MDKLKTFFRDKNLGGWQLIAILSGITIFVTIIVGSIGSEKERQIENDPGPKAFSGGRILSTGNSLYKIKNKRLQNQIDNLAKEQEEISGKLDALTTLIKDLQTRDDSLALPEKTENRAAEEATRDSTNLLPQASQYQRQIEKPAALTNVGSYSGQPSSNRGYNQSRSEPTRRRGPSVISFPTESKRKSKKGITLSSGSFVETILLSGVQAVSGKPYPVLLKAVQAFVGPNKTKIDLSGCFILGKAKGNLNLGRVEIQPYKIACTAKSGQLFERDLVGFSADQNDNSFGVEGEVDLKAGSRLATLTFLSSMIQGISQNIENLQTRTTQRDSESFSSVSSEIVGDKGRYLAAGGAAGAANKMTDFFLKHASGLLPTININSSQKVYVILQDSVELPAWYFKKPKKGTNNDYSYISTLID